MEVNKEFYDPAVLTPGKHRSGFLLNMGLSGPENACGRFQLRQTFLPSRDMKRCALTETLQLDLDKVYVTVKTGREFIKYIPTVMLQILKHFVKNSKLQAKGKGKGKMPPCTGTEALYRPYGP
jgi:hypothetical protein